MSPLMYAQMKRNRHMEILLKSVVPGKVSTYTQIMKNITPPMSIARSE